MVSTVNPKRMLYAQFAAVARAMAHEHRLELLELVAQGERSVEALAQHTGLSIANASQHLQQLRRAALVTAKRDGKHVLYQLADASVLNLLSAMQRVAEKNVAEVDRIIRTCFLARDNLGPVSRAKLMDRMKKGLRARSPARGHQCPAGQFQAPACQARSED